jgi:hypothetical protein
MLITGCIPSIPSGTSMGMVYLAEPSGATSGLPGTASGSVVPVGRTLRTTLFRKGLLGCKSSAVRAAWIVSMSSAESPFPPLSPRGEARQETPVT